MESYKKDNVVLQCLASKTLILPPFVSKRHLSWQCHHKAWQGVDSNETLLRTKQHTRIETTAFRPESLQCEAVSRDKTERLESTWGHSTCSLYTIYTHQHVRVCTSLNRLPIETSSCYLSALSSHHAMMETKCHVRAKHLQATAHPQHSWPGRARHTHLQYITTFEHKHTHTVVQQDTCWV